MAVAHGQIEQFLQGSKPHQAELFDLADDLGQLLEAAAERYSTLIIAKLAQPVASASSDQDYHSVDINHIEAIQARSIGVEIWRCMWSCNCNWIKSLLHWALIKSIPQPHWQHYRPHDLPGSELQTHDWLQSRTGLGELLDHDYGSTSLTRCTPSAIRCSNIKRRWKRFWRQEQTLSL